MQNFELSSELFAALIGVVIAIVMTAIGWLINANREHNRWKRAEKLRAYSEMTNLYYRILVEYKSANKSRDTKLSHVMQMKSIIEESTRLDPTDKEGMAKLLARKDKLKEESDREVEIFDRHIGNIDRLSDEINSNRGAFFIICSPKMRRLLNEAMSYRRKHPQNRTNLSEFNQESWDKLIRQAKCELGFMSRWAVLWEWMHTDIREMRR